PEFDDGAVDRGNLSFCGTDNSICRFNADGLPDVSGNQLGRTHEHQFNASLAWADTLNANWDYYARADFAYLD
ncbi:MAG: hypothetical protein V2J12_00160, partial [Gammaproteobacteria bacterium]|nr:hypothetical protein [Gammaproteobacteria bacterium]